MWPALVCSPPDEGRQRLGDRDVPVLTGVGRERAALCSNAPAAPSMRLSKAIARGVEAISSPRATASRSRLKSAAVSLFRLFIFSRIVP